MTRATLLAAAILALPGLGAATALAQPAFPLQVTGVRYSVPCGISYDPKAPVEASLTLTNASPADVDLAKGEWRVTRSRALAPADPTSPWDVTMTDVEQAARGAIAPGGTVKPGESREVTVAFTPGKYGHFSVLLRASADAPWYRAAGAAVVREPAPGFKPLSPCVPSSSELRSRQGDFRWIALAARYGIRWVRGTLDVRPAPGKDGERDWTRADAMAAAFRQNHVLLLWDLRAVRGMEVPRLGGLGDRLVPRPEDFPKLADYVRQVVTRYGDVIPAAVVGREPWDGGSISHSRATGAYYRDLLRTVYGAAHAAKKDFIVLAGDHITNFEDNLQCVEGATEYLDATSHHTGWHDNRGAVQSAALGKPAWETRDWSSHYDAYVAANLTMKLAGGYLKSNPTTDSGYLFSPGQDHLGGPHDHPGDVYTPSAIGQAVSTWLHFVEDCDFAGRLHPYTLPKILLFKGRAGFERKHVAVILGRVKAYGPLYKEGDGDLDWPQVTGFGWLRVKDEDGALSVYDMSGNALPRTDTGYRIPLTEEPYYAVSGAGAEDVRAKLKAADCEYQGNVFHVSVQDFTRPLDQKPPVRVAVANPLQVEVDATVTVTPPEGWELKDPTIRIPKIAPATVQTLDFHVARAAETPSNRYPFRVKVASRMGTFELAEDLHVAVFRRGTVTVDGDLEDWAKAGAIAVTLAGAAVRADAVEKAWAPLPDLKGSDEKATAARFAGLWDRQFFYVCAEVRDPAAQCRPSMQSGTTFLVHGKPYDYLYWWGPALLGTRGDALKIAFDVNRPRTKDDRWIPAVFQARFDGWPNRLSADYEFDLYAGEVNRLKESYETVLARHLERLKSLPDEGDAGAGPPFEDPAFETAGEPVPELWRLMAPGVPRGNYGPFSPRPERDQGLVRGARVAVRRTETGWRYEAAIPWHELAGVGSLLTRKPGEPFTGKDVRFSFYVLNDGRRALAWTAGRSACRGFQILHPTWLPGEAIETPWGFVEK